MGNLNQASNKAIASKLGAFGTSKLEFTTGEGLSVIEKTIGDFIKKVTSNVESSGIIIRTGNILNITSEIQGDSIVVKAPAYFDFQSKGVLGNARNTKNFTKPVVTSALQLPGGGNYSFKKLNHPGIKSKSFYEKEVPILAKDLAKDVGAFVAKFISLGGTKTISIK